MRRVFANLYFMHDGPMRHVRSCSCGEEEQISKPVKHATALREDATNNIRGGKEQGVKRTNKVQSLTATERVELPIMAAVARRPNNQVCEIAILAERKGLRTMPRAS